MTRTVPFFAVATLVPVPLLIAGALWGSPAAILTIVYITLVVFFVDQLAPADDTHAATARGADVLSAALALLHLPLLALAVAALAGRFGGDWGDRIAVFFAFGLWFGQVSNANAHELIHRSNRFLRGLGIAVFTSLLFGHHATAHLAIHHRYVATPDDPNSARRGEGFYRFWRRAWSGSFVGGWRIEANRLRQRQRPVWHLSNPYWVYLGGAVGWAGLSAILGGGAGLAGYLLLAVYAHSQLLLSDYVQHYGLTRARRADGGYAPLGVSHSWDAPHWMSALLMLNAPRHADHHAHPARPYPLLEEPDATPRLPWSLPVMGGLALIPHLWRRVIHPRLDRLRSAP
jgi:alkane 1-monooxygenase